MRIFGPVSNENEQGDKPIRLRWAGHVGKMEKGRSALKILTGKPNERDLSPSKRSPMELLNSRSNIHFSNNNKVHNIVNEMEV